MEEVEHAMDRLALGEQVLHPPAVAKEADQPQDKEDDIQVRL